MTLVLFPDGTRAEHGEADGRVVAVLPGALAAAHRIELPGLTDRQALAAARLVVAETSLSPLDALHVAVGGEDAGWRSAVAVDRDVMASFLAGLAGEGIDPDAVVPASLLLPRPETGSVRAVIGNEPVVRTPDSAYVDEGLFDDAPVDLDEETRDASIAAAVAVPEVDLRQGVFGRSRRWVIDWVAARRLGRLAAALLVLTIGIELIAVVRIDAAAKRIERANAVAATGAPQPRALPLASLAVGAVVATPETDLGALSVDGAGALRFTARARSADALDQLQARLAASGLRLTATPTSMTAGRASRDFTLGAP